VFGSLFASFVLKSVLYMVEAEQEVLRETECFRISGSVADSPEFVELLGTQGGDDRTCQFCQGSRLPQFPPVVDPSK
jgi:hypothetical protein